MGLFGPAYRSKNEEKALKALESIRDTDTLLGIAGDPTVLKSVRTTAIRKIEDQDILFNIAADRELDTETRKAAISAFTEETRIKYITGDILGSNLNGEMDYLIQIAPDKKALAKEIWRRGMKVGIPNDYGFTAEEIYDIAVSCNTAAPVFKDCLFYAGKLGGDALVGRILDATSGRWGAGGLHRNMGYLQQIRNSNGALCSKIVADWLIATPDNREGLEKYDYRIVHDGTKWPAVNFLSSPEDFLRVHRQYPRLNDAISKQIEIVFQGKGWDFVIPLVEQWGDLSLLKVIFAMHFHPEMKDVIPDAVYQRALEQVRQNPEDPYAGLVTEVLRQAGYLS